MIEPNEPLQDNPGILNKEELLKQEDSTEDPELKYLKSQVTEAVNAASDVVEVDFNNRTIRLSSKKYDAVEILNLIVQSRTLFGWDNGINKKIDYAG